ncbi:MAG: hypothetical protein ACRDD4_13015 [Culicoidibacterales bacterium]
MNNKQKKIAAGALVAFLAVSGTAAFFTSSDLITNVFKTGAGVDVNPGDDIGIDVNEKFEGVLPGPDGIYGTDDDLTVSYDDNTDGSEYGEIKVVIDGDGNQTVTFPVVTDKAGNTVEIPAVSVDGPGTYDVVDNDGNTIGKIVITEDEAGDLVVGPATVLPGATFVKQMKVDSNVDYNQFLRGEVVITVKDVAGKDVTAEAVVRESVAGTKDLSVVYDWTGWTQDGVGLYYYDQVLGAGASTPDVVKSVALSTSADNWWKDKVVSVTLKAEAVQASQTGWDLWSPSTDVTFPTAVDND